MNDIRNVGNCIHGRKFCLECDDKKTPRRPETIRQAHRIIVLMAESAEQDAVKMAALQHNIDELKEAMVRITEIHWGYDGDCGAVSIANEALDDSEGKPIIEESE